MKNKKGILILVITIICIFAITLIATFAYLTVEKKYYGTFDVDVKTKDIDIFEINRYKEANIVASPENFGPIIGESQSDSAIIELSLETSKDESTYCYDVDVVLPNEIVFNYTEESRPELLLTISKANEDKDGSYVDIISDLDITTMTGSVKENLKNIGNDELNKLFKISAKENQKAYAYWKANITLVWFSDLYQSGLDEHKEYQAHIEANLKDCNVE